MQMLATAKRRGGRQLARIWLTLGALWATTAQAAPRWGIKPGQEALLEQALAPARVWPKGWSFTGATIDHGSIDVRFRDPQGVGLGIRLVHPESADGPRRAGAFDIATVSAELPDDMLTIIKARLATIQQFAWTELTDRQGEAAQGPATATDETLAQRGEKRIAAGHAAELPALLAEAATADCALREHWLQRIVARGDPAEFPVALTLAQQPDLCPRALQAAARWTATLGRPGDGETLLRQALGHRPDLQTQLELALLLRQQQRCPEAMAVLAALDLHQVPDIQREIARVTRVYLDCPDRAVLETLRQRADARPPDPLAAFIVGAALHHRDQWRESEPYLKAAQPFLAEEPRIHLYRAMNAFHLGEQAAAEQLVGHAAHLGSRDPDVLYCRAVILGDRDPQQAIADLVAYQQAMATTRDKTAGKEERVRQMLADLEACRGAKNQQRCRELRRVGALAAPLGLGGALLVLVAYALRRWRRRA